jgi:hypothetical protein
VWAQLLHLLSNQPYVTAISIARTNPKSQITPDAMHEKHKQQFIVASLPRPVYSTKAREPFVKLLQMQEPAIEKPMF